MIATEAGKPITVDEFTDCSRKSGSARVKVEIDAAKPLKPGVLIREKATLDGRLSSTRTCQPYAIGVAISGMSMKPILCRRRSSHQLKEKAH